MLASSSSARRSTGLEWGLRIVIAYEFLVDAAATLEDPVVARKQDCVWRTECATCVPPYTPCGRLQRHSVSPTSSKRWFELITKCPTLLQTLVTPLGWGLSAFQLFSGFSSLHQSRVTHLAQCPVLASFLPHFTVLSGPPCA